MQTDKHLLPRCLTFGIVVLAASVAFSANISSDWQQNYMSAVAQARREGKPLLADFSTSWCPNCRMLEKRTFTDPAVTERLKDFVKVYVDGDANPDMVSRFNIQGYPTIVAISPKGEIVNTQVGYVEPGQFAYQLDAIKSRVQAQAMPTAKNASVKDADKQVAQKNTDKTNNASTEESNVPEDSGAGRLLQKLKSETQTADASSVRASASERLQANSTKRTERSTPDREINFYNMQQASPAADAIRSEAEKTTAENNSERHESGASHTQSFRSPEIREVSNQSLPIVAAAEDTTEKIDSARKALKAQQELPQADVRPVSPETKLIAQASGNLPQPLLNAGSTRENSASGAASSAARDNHRQSDSVTSADEKSEKKSSPVTEKSASKKAESGGASDRASTGKTTTKRSVLATIRKLQGGDNQSAAENSVEKQLATANANTRPSPDRNQDQSDQKTDKSKSDKETEESRTDKSDKIANASPAKVKLQVRSNAASESASSNSGNSSSESERRRFAMSSSSNEAISASASSGSQASVEDIKRWLKDADSRLKEQQNKEALAMYTKVVEADQKNISGVADRAFVQMVALMVDRDDDSVRQRAYDKITEFTARYPDSKNMDHYTVIRAMLATDLGKTNEAHSLLDDFPDRFPKSPYAELAYKLWRSLPAATSRHADSGTARSSSARQ
jgi:thioredoxin-like negative regulator of GroEL